VSADPDQPDEVTERKTVEKEAIVTEEDSREETINNQKVDHSVQDSGEENKEEEVT